MRLRILALGALAINLSACSLWPADVASGDSYAKMSEQQRRVLASWDIKARVRTQEQRANLRWKQSAEQFDVLLRGPFGLGGVRISGTPQQVVIDDGESKQISDQPQRDIYQRTGLIVPIAALPYWLLGLAAPGGDVSISRDALGHVSAIEQFGWTVSLSDYQDENGVAFPHQIQLQQPPWFLDMTVTRWGWP